MADITTRQAKEDQKAEALVKSLRDQITSAVNSKTEALSELEKCHKKSADVAVELGIQALYRCFYCCICAWIHACNVHARQCARHICVFTCMQPALFSADIVTCVRNAQGDGRIITRSLRRSSQGEDRKRRSISSRR